MSYPLTAHWLEFSYMVTLSFEILGNGVFNSTSKRLPTMDSSLRLLTLIRMPPVGRVLSQGLSAEGRALVMGFLEEVVPFTH